MCKEILVIAVERVVDKKRIMEKMEGRGGGEAQGVADPPSPLQKKKPTMLHPNTKILKTEDNINLRRHFNDVLISFIASLNGLSFDKIVSP
jgi:hypothetical protein